MFHTVGVPLPGFTESTFTHDGLSRPVYAGGTGPAVIVIHEIPGLHPEVADFAQRVVDAGFSVRMPSLFGTPGRAVTVGYTMRTLAKACVAKEFAAFALNRTSPVIGWLRRLAAEAHAECGGPGVGAVGMCFTGGFALGMMVDDTMLAPVLSQPSLPFPITPSRRRSVGISDADLARVKERAAEGACLMGLRFTDDMAVPASTLRHAAPRARRRVHRGGDRLVEGQPARHPARRALGAHRSTSSTSPVIPPARRSTACWRSSPSASTARGVTHMAEEQHQVSSYTLEQMGVWIELFYDLVFVAAILVFSSAVSHLHDASRIGWVVAVFSAVWWIWLSTTMFTNRFHMADVVHRGLVLLQMILVVLVAIEARAGVRDDEVILLCTYAALVASIALMYWRAARAHGPHATFARQLSVIHVVAALCFVGAAALPESARIVGAAVGMAVMIAPAAWRSIRLVDFPPLDEEHLVDRMGAFTIIVCGEAFVKVAIAVSDSKIDGIDIVALTFQFILTFALWASYFEDIPYAGIDQQRFAPWISFHLVTQLGIAGTAIGVSKLVAIRLPRAPTRRGHPRDHGHAVHGVRRAGRDRVRHAPPATATAVVLAPGHRPGHRARRTHRVEGAVVRAARGGGDAHGRRARARRPRRAPPLADRTDSRELGLNAHFEPWR